MGINSSGGRSPKPTHLKIIEGEKNKNRINKNEPKPRPVAPNCPKHLDKVARAEWNRMAPLLEKLGILTEIDGTAFAAYCQLYSRWIAIEKELRNSKLLMLKHTIDGAGNEHIEAKANPLEVMARQTLQQIRSYCMEFGMTPSSRSRMTIVGKEEDDEFEGLLT